MYYNSTYIYTPLTLIVGTINMWDNPVLSRLFPIEGGKWVFCATD